MTTKYMPITDEAAWLEKRGNYITSTMVSALFGLSQYNTAFELYHITRGNIEAVREENNFMRFGKIIEAPITEMIAIEHPDWVIKPFSVFAYDDDDKIGSSFDRQVFIGGKRYLLEIKSISYAQYKKTFTEHAPDDIEASPHYECQMMNELELVATDPQGFDGIIMAVFILDTRELRYIFRKYDAEMGAALRLAVREFWSMKEAPAPDFGRDKSLIARLCPGVDPANTLDATENGRITELAGQYKASKNLIKQEEKTADKAMAELLTLIGTARYVFTKDHRLSVSDTKASVGKEITADMVGTFSEARKGYKRVTVTATNEGDDE